MLSFEKGGFVLKNGGLGTGQGCCCGGGCANCTVGKLPDTVTVAISGKIADFAGFDNQQRAGLGKILRTKVKSNFGSGASLEITEPGGHPQSGGPNDCPSNAGPISEVDNVIAINPEGDEKPNGTDGIYIRNAGNGYAIQARTQPVVTAKWIDTGSGCVVESGIDFNVNVGEGSSGGIPFWYIIGLTGVTTCVADLILFEFEEGTVVVESPLVLPPSSSTDPTQSNVLVKGYFYKPDIANVITADVEVEITQQEPFAGSGAQIEAIIQDDPTKNGFGSILKYRVTNAGHDYLAWYYRYPCVCEPTSYVLPRSSGCKYSLCICEGSPGPALISLSATSCTGSGATGHATQPVGLSAGGPITETVVDTGGSGYALLGRVEPTVDRASGGSGSDLKITSTLKANKGKCDLPTWGVTSVSVTNGGYNYAVNDVVTFATDQLSDSFGGNHDESAGTGTVTKTTTAAPTLEAQPANNLTFDVSIASNGDMPQTWRVSDVTLSGSNLSGWLDGQAVSITTGEHDTTFRPADVRIRTTREEPTVSAATSKLSGGTGASLGVTLTKFTGDDDRDQWKVSSLMGGGGSGYSAGDDIVFTLDSDKSHEVAAASASVSGVSQSGAITSTKITSAGAYWRDSGNADIAQVYDGGSYALAGIVQAIQVTLDGNYYREDSSATPIVPTVTVTVSQTSPSNGIGAELGVDVNTNTQDPAFGGVTKFLIKSGGSGYLAATTLTSDCMSVEYLGPTTPPTFTRNGRVCSYTVSADNLVKDCSDFSWKHSASQCNGIEVAVSPGGTTKQPDGTAACCGCCCVPDPDNPESKNPVRLDPDACSEAQGVFIANKACEGLTCPETVLCCVAPNIIGAESKEQCKDDLNGRVLTQKNPPPEACSINDPCACLYGMTIDSSECEGYVDLRYVGSGYTNHENEAVQIAVIAGPYSIGLNVCDAYYFLKRNSVKVDFSTHCGRHMRCSGKSLRYIYTECETGEVKVDNASAYWDIHDGLTYHPDANGDIGPPLLQFDQFGSGPQCILTLVPAP